MVATREQRLRETLRRLSALHAAEVSVLEESIAILEAELDALTHPIDTTPMHAEPVAKSDHPIVDRSQMCIVHGDRRCFLGNTLMLKLFDRLLRRPNRYLSYDILLTEVWHGIREPSSVRSVVKELRHKLRAAGMEDFSRAIDGHVSGHYGLFLERHS